MEENFLINTIWKEKPPPLERLSVSLPKAQVKLFMNRVRDLETSLRGVLTMECLTMSLRKYSTMR